MLFSVDVTDARKTEHFLHLRIESNGEWFWLARYWDVDYARSGPQALANFLGTPLDEVFPIRYNLRQYVLGGDPTVVTGEIPKEPRERLSEDVIIKMAVGKRVL